MVYGFGGLLAINGTLQVGTLVALAALLRQLYGPLTSLSNVQVDVMTALVSFERVFEVLDLPPMVADAARREHALARRRHRRVRATCVFRYPSADEVSLASLESVAVLDATPSQTVLNGVSFTVRVRADGRAGRTVRRRQDHDHRARRTAVRRRRGSGPDRRAGRARSVTQDSLHAAIGVVTQDAHMFHDTIRANLLYARPDATDAELYEAVRAAHIGDLVASLPDGLDTVVGDRGYRLSGGEKQRLAIARLLLKAPRIVVLDEATAHLDSESEAAVQRALGEALTGRTSLVIAHRLSTVRDADQILVVDDGRIVERGTHTELLVADGLYADLYRTQFETQEAPA